MTVINQCLI